MFSKAYVRDETEDGEVIVRFGDHLVHLSPDDAADLATRIFKVKQPHGYFLYHLRIEPDLTTEANNRTRIDYDDYSRHVVIHTTKYLHDAGYRQAQIDIQRALGVRQS